MAQETEHIEPVIVRQYEVGPYDWVSVWSDGNRTTGHACPAGFEIENGLISFLEDEQEVVIEHL